MTKTNCFRMPPRRSTYKYRHELTADGARCIAFEIEFDQTSFTCERHFGIGQPRKTFPNHVSSIRRQVPDSRRRGSPDGVRKPRQTLFLFSGNWISFRHFHMNTPNPGRWDRPYYLHHSALKTSLQWPRAAAYRRPTSWSIPSLTEQFILPLVMGPGRLHTILPCV